MKKLLSLLAFLSITALNARDFTPEEMEILSKAYAKKPEKVKEHTAECYGVEGSLDPKSIECRGRRVFLQQSEKECLQDEKARQKLFETIERMKLMGPEIGHDKNRLFEIFFYTLTSNMSSNVPSNSRLFNDLSDAEIKISANAVFYATFLFESEEFIKKEFNSGQ